MFKSASKSREFVRGVVCIILAVAIVACLVMAVASLLLGDWDALAAYMATTLVLLSLTACAAWI